MLYYSGRYFDNEKAKFDEKVPIITNLSEYQTIYNNLEFTKDEIKKYEIFSIKALGYKLNYFTPYHYINFFIVYGYIYSDELIIRSKMVIANFNKGN